MEISSAGGSSGAAARGGYGDHSKVSLKEVNADMEGKRSEYAAPSSRCSIRHLHDLLSGLDKHKRQLVSQIGFGGILYFPPLRQVDRRFSVWLMSRVDVAMRELVIDGTRRFKFSKDDVAVVFGIPNGGRSVVGEGIPSKAMVSTIMNQYLGGTSKGNRSIKMARQIIERDHNGNMSSHEEDCFKVAFVIYIMSTLLAPGATHDCVAVDYWNAIAEPSEIQMFDWCGYVMDRLLDAVGKLKSGASKCSRAPNVMGCCLFLQVMYLDSIDLGIWNMAHTNLPRIRCFPAERMRSMILADKVDDGCGASENNFGKCKMRSPFGVCYHWASGSSRCGECPMKCRHVGLWEATISVVRNLRVPMEATGPVYLAIADFENHCIHLTGAGGLNFISALLSIIEPFNVGFRYSVGGCQNEFEPGFSIIGSTAGDRGGESSDCNARKRDIPFTCAALSYFDDLLRGQKCVCCPEMGYWNSMTVRQQNGGRIYDGSYMGQCSVGYCSSDYSLETWDANLIVRRVMAKYYWFVHWSKVSSWTDRNIIGWGCCSKNVHVLRKVTVGIEDAKSPWDLGAQWRYDPDKVSSVLKNWLVGDGLPETNTSCFVHHTPKYIEVGASAVKQQFLGFSEMEMDMFDALMRRFKQCDDELYRGEGRLRWRHFIESDFMGSILAGVFDVLEPVVRENFVGSHISYDVPNCKMIFFPFILEHRWVCYAWRMEDNRIIIFDPGCSYVPCANGDRSHMCVVSALKWAICDVAEEYFIGWMKSWDDATVEMFQLGRRQSSWINCSGILCAYFCRTFDGREMKPDLQTVDIEGISALLLGEVIHLENNDGRVLASSLL